VNPPVVALWWGFGWAPGAEQAGEDAGRHPAAVDRPQSRHNLSGVAAILVFRRFTSGLPWASSWCAYVNPWSEAPPPGWLLDLPRWVPGEEGLLTFFHGRALDEVLGPAFAL